VSASSGKPVNDATVLFVAAYNPTITYWTRTDRLGRFELELDEAGFFTAVANKEGFMSAARTLSLKWGSIVTSDLTLQDLE
jgi:hypothetical protein